MEPTTNRRPSGQAGSGSAHPFVTDDERRRIADRAFEIAVGLGLPLVTRTATYARFGNGAGSLKVNYAGPHKGTYTDFPDEAGDMIALIRRITGCGFREAKEIALLERAPDPEIVKAKAKPVAEIVYNRTEFARRQLVQARSVLGTIASKYPTDFRGIPAETIHRLDTLRSIRFLPAFKSKPDSVWTSPAFALVATDLDGVIFGFQAVRLQRTGQKREGKFAKQSCGDLRDAQAVGWLNLADWNGGDVVLTEGPEDAMSIYAARPGPLTGAALGGIKRLALFGGVPKCRRLIIAAQNDAPDSKSAKSLTEACEQFTTDGFQVWLAYPPAGIKDANDLLRERGLDAVRAMLDSAVLFTTPTPPKGKADETAAAIDAATKPEPYWPRVDQDAAAASAKLETLLDRWMSDVERWLDAKDYQDQQTRAFVNDGMTAKEKRDTRRQIARTTRDAFPDVDLKAPPRIQIAGAAGLGKSSTLRRVYLRHPRLWSRQFHGFLPTLKLAADFETAMERECGDAFDSPSVALHKGRSHACHRPATAALVGKVPSLYAATCKSGDIVCPFYGECGYIASWQNQTPGMHLFVHDYMTLPKILQFPKADFAFVDEDATQTLLTHAEIGAAILAEPGTYQTAALTGDQGSAAALGARVLAAIAGDQPILAALRVAGISRKDLKQLATWAEPAEELPTINPAMTDRQILALAQTLRANDGDIVARILRQLANEMRHDREIAHGVAYYAHTKGHDAVIEGKIGLHRRKKVANVPKGVPLLIIDADADLDTNRVLYGENLVGHTITAPRRGWVTQVSNATLPKSYVIPEASFREPDASMIERGAVVRASILAYVTGKAEGRRVLVGTNRPIRCAFTGEDAADKLPVAVEAHGVTWTHFGAILGVDDWKDYDVVILVGREQMAPAAAERLARAIYCDDPEALNLTGGYGKAERFHRMRNGSPVGVDVYEHADPRVQRRVEAARERGMCQMIDRLRLIHGRDDREVIIMSNLPLPGVEVDQMTTLDKLLGNRTRSQDLDRLISHARETWGVLPLVPEFLAEHAGEIVGSVRTARRIIKEINTLKTANAQYKFPLSVGRLSSARFWRRAINQRRPSMALFFADEAGGAAALERLFGPVAVSISSNEAEEPAAAAVEIDPAAFEPDEPALTELAAAGQPIELHTEAGVTELRDRLNWIKAISTATGGEFPGAFWSSFADDVTATNVQWKKLEEYDKIERTKNLHYQESSL